MCGVFLLVAGRQPGARAGSFRDRFFVFWALLRALTVEPAQFLLFFFAAVSPLPTAAALCDRAAVAERRRRCGVSLGLGQLARAMAARSWA